MFKKDEFLYKRHLPRFPPTGKLTSKSVLAKKKAPTEADLVKKRKQEQLQEERDARKKAKAEAKAVRMIEKSEKKRIREEKKEKDRLDKLQKKVRGYFLVKSFERKRFCTLYTDTAKQIFLSHISNADDHQKAT